MPAIHIRGTTVDAERASKGLPHVARAVAAAVPCGVDGVWCTFAALEAQTVGEDPRPNDGRILYIDVWIRPRDDEHAVSRALEAACTSAAAAFAVPVEDVWGTLNLVEAGRVFAGGRPVAGQPGVVDS